MLIISLYIYSVILPILLQKWTKIIGPQNISAHIQFSQNKWIQEHGLPHSTGHTVFFYENGLCASFNWFTCYTTVQQEILMKENVDEFDKSVNLSTFISSELMNMDSFIFLASKFLVM